MYWSHQATQGRPPFRKKNLQDLLRLTLGAVELSSTRREALSSVAAGAGPKWLPGGLGAYQHAVYETGVVFEFSQLALHDFTSHGNEAVWERPLTYLPPGHKNWRTVHIDLALFSQERQVETRIEFGRADVRSRPRARDVKLQEDAEKLLAATDARLAFKNDDEPSGMEVENYIILWDERDSREGAGTKKEAKLTAARGNAWLERCESYAEAATQDVGVPVVLETVAASSLMTLEHGSHRSAFAAIYSIG